MLTYVTFDEMVYSFDKQGKPGGNQELLIKAQSTNPSGVLVYHKELDYQLV